MWCDLVCWFRHPPRSLLPMTSLRARSIVFVAVSYLRPWCMACVVGEEYFYGTYIDCTHSTSVTHACHILLLASWLAYTAVSYHIFGFFFGRRGVRFLGQTLCSYACGTRDKMLFNGDERRDHQIRSCVCRTPTATERITSLSTLICIKRFHA